ncbi:MAG: hypothetical protein M1365_01850 [Actinobacteria bacterium]|nr:hypothetical protein [Actinomycetota bacterium]
MYFFTAGILNLFGFSNFAQVIRVLAIGISILSIFNIALSFRKNKPRINKKAILIFFPLIAFVTLIYFLIWLRNTPYPLQLSWDTYEHITLANTISRGKLSLLTSQISDTFTFNSYSPLFQILLSLPKIIFQRNLLGVYWWLQYWHYLLTIVASFFLAKKIFNSNFFGFVSAVVASLVFESIMVYSSLFLIPQTLVALIMILIYIQIKQYRLILLIIAAIVVFLMHYVVGVLCLSILVVSFLVNRYNPSNGFLNKVVIFSTLLSAGLIGLNFLGRWQTLGIEEASHFNFSLPQKIVFLFDWYGLTLFAFSLIGYIFIVIKGNQAQKLLLAIALLVFGLSLAPFSYFLKFFVLGRYFVNLLLVCGIGVLLIKLPRFFRMVGFFWIVVVFLITFYKNQLVYKEPLRFENIDTQISKEEVAAGEWLSLNLSKDTFLISDPGTQYVLEAVSGINTQGGAYMNLSTRKTLSEINDLSNKKMIKEKLLNIKDQLSSENKAKRDTIFVIGGRYFAWQNFSEKEKESFFYNVWAPKIMTEQDSAYVDFLKSDQDFKLLYKNDEIAVFQIL